MAVVNDVPTSHFSTARDIMSGVKYRQLLHKLHDDGWRHDRTTGSHMMYVHPTKPGPVVVPAATSATVAAAISIAIERRSEM